MDRRRFLRAAAAAGIPVALAGCTGDGGDGGSSPTDSPTDSPTATASPTDAPTPTDSPTSTATEAPTDTSTATEEPMDTAMATEQPADTPTATDSPTATDTPTATESPTPTRTPTPMPDMTVDVGAGGKLRFDPESFEISAGDTVMWVWKSGGHNVKPRSEDAIPSGSDWTGSPGGGLKTYDQGYKYSYTFETTGTYEYQCNPHQSSGMLGSFTVK